ncbi:MAG: hypothetical protein HQK49_18605 [Oligoflexia bacterium]|nr:hypothetical protein [Oligoflexia bacterium]
MNGRILFIIPSKDGFGFKPTSIFLLSVITKSLNGETFLFDTTYIDLIKMRDFFYVKLSDRYHKFIKRSVVVDQIGEPLLRRLLEIYGKTIFATSKILHNCSEEDKGNFFFELNLIADQALS